MSLNTLTKADILSIIAEQSRAIDKLERLLQGQPIGTVRIADLAVTDAKIASLSADKITAGTLIVAVGVGESGSGGILVDGENVRIVMYDSVNRLCLGDDGT